MIFSSLRPPSFFFLFLFFLFAHLTACEFASQDRLSPANSLNQNKTANQNTENPDDDENSEGEENPSSSTNPCADYPKMYIESCQTGGFDRCSNSNNSNHPIKEYSCGQGYTKYQNFLCSSGLKITSQDLNSVKCDWVKTE